MTKVRHTEIRTVEVEVSFIYRPARHVFPKVPKKTWKRLAVNRFACELERSIAEMMTYGNSNFDMAMSSAAIRSIQ